MPNDRRSVDKPAATPPRFGIRLHGGVTPQRCVELARCGEAHGFTSVWFAENPFNRGILPAAAACSVMTERLRIGIGVFNPFNRHPTLMAMEIGALDEPEFRIEIDAGPGYPGAVPESLGRTPVDRKSDPGVVGEIEFGLAGDRCSCCATSGRGPDTVGAVYETAVGALCCVDLHIGVAG